jgi:GT2 family glycosyltransferase
VLRQVGGFSESFRDYGIDPDLTAKILFSGYDVALTKHVAIHHFRNWETDRQSPAYQKIQRLQEQYQRKYDAKYGHFKSSATSWIARKAFWRSLQRMFPKQLNIDAPSFMGIQPRDLNNVFCGRFIRLLDPLLCIDKPFHLVQHCSKSKLPKELPGDPQGLEDDILHVR